VRFAAGVAELLRTPDQILLEVGPGRTLNTFARQNPGMSPERVLLTSLRHPSEQQSDVAFALTTLGRLWLAGVPLDWLALHAGGRRLRLSLPTYPFERQRYWLEAQPAPFAADSCTTGDLGARIDMWANPESLRAMAPAPQPGAQSLYPRPPLATTYVAPSNQVEQQIIDAWQKLLGIAQIGVHDNFFELGGHSLMATQLISRLSDLFQVELPLRSLFEASTVADLAALVIQHLTAAIDSDSLAKLAELSEAEVRALLMAERDSLRDSLMEEVVDG
jgi:acyl transferase domain-containing protein